MLLVTLAAILLGSSLAGIKQITAGEQKYCQNEAKFNGVFSRKNLSKIKAGTYIINVDEYESIETYLKVLYVNTKNVTYPDSSGVFQRIRKFIGNKNITANIH